SAQPPQGELGQQHARPARNAPQPLDRPLAALELLPLEPIDLAAVVIVREGGRLPVLAGEQACGERPECQEREATFAAQWQLALFYVAIEQVVGALIRRQGSDGQRPRDLQVSGVAEPDREGLSLELQPIERFELPF